MTNSCPHLLEIALLGRTWRIERPASLEELWDRLAAEDDPPRSGAAHSPLDPDEDLTINMADVVRGFENDDRIPYWTEIWPAGIALAEWLGERPKNIAGRKSLDLGCGLGLSAIVGAACGARVLGMDYEPLALYYARRNQQANLGTLEPEADNLQFVAADWRKPCFKPGVFETIWAGDIMYERRFMEPVARFIRHSLAPGGRVWIAEPGRGIYPLFAQNMQAGGWRADIIARKQARLPGGSAAFADIQIWELARKNQP